MSVDLPPQLPRNKRRELAEKCVQLRDAPDRRDEYLAARRELVESMTRLIYAIAAKRAGPDGDTAELLGELTIAALEAVDDWRPGGMAIASWVRWKVSLANPIDSPIDAFRLPADLASPPANASHAAMELDDELDLLDPDEQLAVRAHFLWDCSYREIATHLGVGLATAHEMVKRGIAKLNGEYYDNLPNCRTKAA